jgi:uncharacterized membrane protein
MEQDMEHGAAEPGAEGGRETIDAILIGRSRTELYAYCRDFTHMPKYMERVQQVTEIDALSSRWTVLDAQGQQAEWEVIVTDDERDRLIAWSTSGRTPAHESARLEFEDVPAGTRVTAVVSEAPPEGILDQLLDRVAGEPAPLPMRPNLKRLKALMEAGEPVQLPASSAQAAAAAERGIGVIAPERSQAVPVSDDLQAK